MGDESKVSLLGRYACRRGQPAAQIVARQQADKTLQEALRVEPRLWAVLEQARKQRNTADYSRPVVYSRLKKQWSRLVGFEAHQAELATMDHYDAVMRAVVEWLPSDISDLDLDPETFCAWCAEAGIDAVEPCDEDGDAWDARGETLPNDDLPDSIPLAGALDAWWTEVEAQMRAAHDGEVD